MSDEEVERRLEELAQAVDALVRIDRPSAVRARGRQLRVRRRLVLATGVTGMAATVGVALAVAPGSGRGATGTTGASGGGAPVASATSGTAPSSSPAVTSPAAPPTTATTPTATSSGAAMLAGPNALIGVTAEQAQQAWAKCLADDAVANAKMRTLAPVNGVTMPQIKPRDPNPSHHSILYAMKITANPNEGGAGISVLALTEDGKTVEDCRDRSGDWSGIKDYSGFDTPWSSSTPVLTDACNGEYDLCYPVLEVAPEPSTRNPFNWLDFGRPNAADVTRVTVQYGGPQRDAVIIDGHWIASGTLTGPVSTAPRVRGFDANGKQVYDSMQDPHYDQASH
jgi:hypothetical protein